MIITPPPANPPVAHRPLVTRVPPAAPVLAARHFRWRLEFETDAADVHADLAHGRAEFLLVDARAPDAFAAGHLPGAVNMPHWEIDESVADRLPPDRVLVAYGSGPACNAATKAAAALADLGFSVKEMLGGFESWQRAGHPVEGSEPHAA